MSSGSSATTKSEASLEPHNLPDPLSFARAKDFWPTQEALKEKWSSAKEKRELHFVFLEGCGGSGKKGLLRRLNRLGHSIVFHPYLPFLMENSHYYSPIRDHSILQMKWLNKLMTDMERTSSLAKTGKDYKSSIVFVHRSPLSSYHYSPNKAEADIYLSMMKQIKTVFSASVVLCKADPVRVQERLGERLLDPPDKEKKLRAVLGERTEMSAILREIEGYDKLLEEKENGEPLIDAIIHTTSEKQSVAQILKTYGIEMNWVWEDLKSRSSRGHPTTNQPKKYI